MELDFKPNLGEALDHWRAFWNRDIIKRPCIAVTAPKEGVQPVSSPPIQYLPDVDFDKILDQAEVSMASRYYGGEAMLIGAGGEFQLFLWVGGVIREAYRFFAPYVLQWHGGGDGAPETWPSQFPPDSRVVLGAGVKTPDEARVLADKMWQACGRT